jgi:hypothetical protein
LQIKHIQPYIQFDVFSINPSDDFDDLFQSELLLDVILIVDRTDPCKDPAQVHIRVIVLVIKVLLHADFSLADSGTSST